MAKRWYVVNAYSNFEHKVAEGIREAAARRGLEHAFDEILVPTETVTESRRGRKVDVEHKHFPGYVLVRMELTDGTWALVRNVPKVTGFLESGGRPSALRDAEAEQMLGRLKEEAARPKAARGPLYEIGETVRVTEGPFASFSGLVDAVDPEKGRVVVSVSIFGRATPVDLEYGQVEKT